MTNYDFDVTNVLERKPEIRQRNPQVFVRQRIGNLAAGLSRAGALAARVELVNEALCRLVELLYQADTDGAPANIDPVTYRVLIPLPWGRSGWKRWGMRYHEALVMRAIMLDRMRRPRPPVLFEYNDVGRSWHLSLYSYPDHGAALRYLERHPVLISEWRDALAIYRNGNERPANR